MLDKIRGYAGLIFWVVVIAVVIMILYFLKNLFGDNINSVVQMRRYEDKVKDKIDRWQDFLDSHPVK